MTQKTTVAQSSSSEELWAAYERQKVQESRLRDRWHRLSASTQAIARSERQAWDALRAASDRRQELFDAAYLAEFGISFGDAKLAA